LIALFKAEGKLEQSPCALALNRTVDLHQAAAEARLRGQRVLVTGGAGCVGTRLIPLLASLGAAEIAIVDIAEVAADGASAAGTTVQAHRVDIRNVPALDAVFAQFRPQVVFHLAGIREPGRAEAVVRDAIDTNVFGTRNVIQACLRHGVEDAVYSSTGKCFAYVSDHVYTGSKKLAEAQWVVAARGSTSTRFRCTRFTHVMENGLVAQDIAKGIAGGLIGLHGPDRYFNIQNLRQATHLLVNALALAAQTPADGFWSAVDLGWPVNTLELALYNIERSGAPVAISFLGVPHGYDESFFRGQFCWSGKTEYHPLVNALEAPSGFGDDTGTMVGARVQPFSEIALAAELGRLEAALGQTSTDNPVSAKCALNQAVTGLARATFAAADLPHLVDVLWWGAAPAWAGEKACDAARFHHIIGLLTDTVAERLGQAPGPLCPETRHKLQEVAQTLAQLEDLALQRDSLQAVLAMEPPRRHAARPSVSAMRHAVKV
jgi:nucleoside-diphosphate-sugar epimerase